MPTPKILLTRRWPSEVEHYLSERYQVTVNEHDTPMDAAALKAVLASYDAVCPTVTDKLTADVLAAGAGKVKVLGNYGVGVSHIDLQACKRLGIVVTNTPDVLTDATAEIAVTLMLMVARRAGEGERQVRARQWPGWAPTRMIGADVTGKTLGLVGFGRIGQATAYKARHGFGMRILYYSRKRAAPDVEARTGGQHCASLDELLESSDFVSLHCPGGVETRHLLSAERLDRMKRSAFLINTARGEIVDEVALAEALRNRVIAGAGLDVYEHEPRVPEAFLGLENVVLLPHLGSATLATRVYMGMRVAENLERFFAGLEPADRVA
ncbi:MAG TPA: D-glycerate dehydrogenase [Steroidobacteraceae bacterium]|nr:D-glycerate dehydrogenase [Steroidobacteraceae bacterium]